MPASVPLVDVNVNLGQWPLRRVPCDEPEHLIAKLRAHDVAQAWAGSYDGLFHDDLTAANNHLVKTCRGQSAVTLVPFGEINPLAPGWEAELRRCSETHHMPGIRLHPNYHGYALDHPNFARLLQAAAERKLIVQLVMLMEDARMMHPLMRVPPVDLAPLKKLVAQATGLRLILLNALSTASRTDQLYRLLDAGEVYVEIAMLEGVGGIETVLKDIPAERILFGSHSPSLYFESAALKLQESALPTAHLRAISHENARRLLPNA
jgi:predicted TIM-barrel fold metal-dependent hydrolase